VHVNGKVIRTTGEHPFYVWGRGWIAAKALVKGDLLRRKDGTFAVVEEVFDTGVEETVYNCTVADYHTYFVGGEDWGFSVWAHNTCAVSRWGRDGQFLEPGDWVMKGGKTWYNYIMSGKWQPGLTNQFATFGSGQTFQVFASSVHLPPMSNPLNWIKALIGQRIYRP
jgi:hypothetical protein